MASKRARVWLVAGGLLVAAVAAVAVLFDWNWLRQPVEAMASEVYGRPVTIGDLDVSLGATTAIHAGRVAIANPPWASRPQMASARAIEVAVRLWPLLRGRVELPEVRLDGPDLRLERRTDGDTNWTSGRKGGGKGPDIGRLVIVDGRFGWRDPDTRLDAQVVTEGEQVHARGAGVHGGRPARFELQAGSLLNLRGDAPYPVDLAAEIGGTSGRLRGTLDDPLSLDKFRLDLRLAGPDMAEAFPIFGIPTPSTRPYSLHGDLLRNGPTWSFRDFSGRVGESDLSGGLTVVVGGDRPLLRANLTSRRLVLADLAGFIGGQPGGKDVTRGPGRVLPDRPVELARLHSMDVDVRLTGERVEAPGLPMDRLEARMVLRDGVARLQPLSFTIAQGTFGGTMVLDGRQRIPQAQLDMAIRDMDLRRFLAGTRFAPETSGTLTGRIELKGRGRSTAELLGASDGRVTLLMQDGSLSALMLEFAGLDLAEALGFATTGDKPVPVRCLVADFQVQGGTAASRALVLDTADTVILGKGTVDLGTERLDLRLEPQPKDVSPFTIRAPVEVHGRLGAPDLAVDPSAEAVRGGLAAALGALLGPLGALVPFLDLGQGHDQPCGKLIQQAKGP